MRGFALSRSEAGCSCTGSCTAQTFILRWTRLLGAAVNLFRVEVSGSLCVAVKEEPRDRGATPVKAVELWTRGQSARVVCKGKKMREALPSHAIFHCFQ